MKNKLFLAIVVLLVLGIGAAAGAGYLLPGFQSAQRLCSNRDWIPTGRDAGILVGAVTPDSPGAKAGIVRGDIILEANGKAVNQPVQLADIVKGLKAGDQADPFCTAWGYDQER